MSPETTTPPAIDQQKIDAAAKIIQQEQQASATRVGDISSNLESQVQIVMAHTPETIEEPDLSSAENLGDMKRMMKRYEEAQTAPSNIASGTTETFVQTMTPEEAQKLAQTLSEKQSDIASASAGVEKYKLDQSLAGSNTLAYAHLGGGAESVNFNPDDFQHLSHQEIVALEAHELAHATDQVMPSGSVQVSTSSIVNEFGLTEGDAEKTGRRASGGVCPGTQPTEYAEAEKGANEIVSLTSQSSFDTAMSSGDTGALQKEVWEARIEKGQMGDDGIKQAESVMAEAEATGHVDEAKEIAILSIQEEIRQRHAEVERVGQLQKAG